MAERINAGYTIIQSVPVGDTEFVLGKNKKAPDLYVTWRCDGGTNYYWGHYFSDFHRAQTDLFDRALEKAQWDEDSPWGTVIEANTICDGVYYVSTRTHSGIMVGQNVARAFMSPSALRCGVVKDNFNCFEREHDAPVAIRELLDAKKMTEPVNDCYAPGEYSKFINARVKQFHPEYWQDRQRRLEAAARNKREKERER